MSTELHSALIVAVVALVTMGIRFLPFAVFRKGAPGTVLYLGKVLPHAVMGMLVVYCLRNVSLLSPPHGIPEASAVVLVVLLHRWKHNTLISIVAGTAAYMLLTQLIF